MLAIIIMGKKVLSVAPVITGVPIAGLSLLLNSVLAGTDHLTLSRCPLDSQRPCSHLPTCLLGLACPQPGSPT